MSKHKHKRAKRDATNHKDGSAARDLGRNIAKDAAGGGHTKAVETTQVPPSEKKFGWLYSTSVLPYTEHRCYEPKWDQTKHIEWRAKEAAMWAGKCILRLNELRAQTVKTVKESDEFSKHYCAAVEFIFQDEDKVKESFHKHIQTLEKATNAQTVHEVMLQVSTLLIGHDGLIIGFEYFLPPDLTMIMLLVQQKAALGAAIASDPSCLNRLSELHQQIVKAVGNAVEQFTDLTPKLQDTDSTRATASDMLSEAATTNSSQATPAQLLAGTTLATLPIRGQAPVQSTTVTSQSGEQPQASSQAIPTISSSHAPPAAAPMILQAIPGPNPGQLFLMSQPGNPIPMGYAIPNAVQYVQQLPGQQQHFIQFGAPPTGQQAPQFHCGVQFNPAAQQQVQYVFTGSLPTNSGQVFAPATSSNNAQQLSPTSAQHQPTIAQVPTGTPMAQPAQFMPPPFTIIQAATTTSGQAQQDSSNVDTQAQG